MQKKFKSIVSLIPAREGSQAIRNKNIYKINGKPLVCYTIETSMKTKLIDKSFVFTDSNKYKKICEKEGIDFPFNRNKLNAKNNSSDKDVINEFLIKFNKYYGYYPEIIVYLRPTQPLRTSNLIDNCLIQLKKNKRHYSAIRTIRKASYPAFWMKKIVNNRIYNLVDNFKKFSSKRRQDLPRSYICDGYVDAFYTKSFLKEGEFPAKSQLPYLNEKIPFLDIDNIEDIRFFKKYLMKNK